MATPFPIDTSFQLQLAKEYVPMDVTASGIWISQVMLLLYLKANAGILVTFSPMVKVTIGVAPSSLVPLLNTGYCELVVIEVQFAALKCTVAILGQFQKA